MLFASDFRKTAREALHGKWGVAILTGFVASLLGAAITGVRNPFFNIFNDENNRDSFLRLINNDVGLIIVQFLVAIWSIVIVWGIVTLIIGGAITLGYAAFNQNLVSDKKAELSDIFSQFDRFGAAFLMQLLRAIFIFLWTLLLIIPGIIASFSYSMTPYVMLDHPELSAYEAIGFSKQLMRGNKWRLFCLNFSFIGWAFLCLFSFGIGYLWLFPYIEASNAAFYREISNNKSAFPH